VTRGIGPKTTRGQRVIMAMTSSMAKEATNVSAAGTSRTSTNGGSREDKHSSSKEAGRIENGATKERLLYNRGRQREELLYLQQIWAYSLTL